MNVQLNHQVVNKLPKNVLGNVSGYSFKSRVMGGIPVLVDIVEIEDDCIELAIYDRKGYRAKWVENRLSDEQWEHLESEAYVYNKKQAIERHDEARIDAYIDYMGF